MRKIIIDFNLSPGDHLMLTAFLRDLHLAHPDWAVNVRVNCRDFYIHSPYIDPYIDVGTPGVEVFQAHYNPAINESNQVHTRHFVSGFHLYFKLKHNIDVPLTELRGSITLLDSEKVRTISQPYWVVMAGGKSDFPAKLWDRSFFQNVIDLLPETTFVQVGGKGAVGAGTIHHIHEALHGDNVVNLLGKTTLRELASLVYNAEGILCPVTCGLHLAAALNRPCVCLAGGREPPWWTAYSDQAWRDNCHTEPPADFVETRYLSSINKLKCCMGVGCWRSTVEPSGSDRHCVDVVEGPTQKQPRCMALMQPKDVIEAMCSYNLPSLPNKEILERVRDLPRPTLKPITSLPIILPRQGEITPNQITVFMHITTDTDVEFTQRLELLLANLPRGYTLHLAYQNARDSLHAIAQKLLHMRVDHVSITSFTDTPSQFAATTDWVLWLGPHQTITKPDFFARVNETLRNAPRTSGRIFIGPMTSAHISQTYYDAIRRYPWFTNHVVFVSQVVNKGTPEPTVVVQHPEPAWALTHTAVLNKFGWPTAFHKGKQEVVTLGLALQQDSVQLLDVKFGVGPV